MSRAAAVVCKISGLEPSQCWMHPFGCPEQTLLVVVSGHVNGLSPEGWARLRPGMWLRSIRPVEYQDETVPADTLATALEPADVEGFLVVAWRDRPGLYFVHARDVEEAGSLADAH